MTSYHNYGHMQYTQQLIRDRKRVWMNKLLNNFRVRAADAGMEFKLSQKVIITLWRKQDGKCYWFKTPLTTKFAAHETSCVSIDRLDNKKGYTPDNVVLSSRAANSL